MRTERLAPAAPKPAASAVGVIALLFLTFGGYVKDFPALADVGDTLTRLSALIVLVLSVHRILGGRIPPAATGSVVVLFLTFVPAMLVDPPTTYTTEKLTVELPLMFLTIMGGLVLLAPARARRQWVAAVVALGAVAAVLALVFPSTTVVDALAVEGGNTIDQGRTTGAGAIALFTLAMVHRKHRLLLLTGALVMSASMIASGSRGPTIGAAVAVLLAVAFSPSRSRGPRVVATIVTLLAAVYLAFAANLVGDRLLTFQDASAEARFRLWDVGVGLIGTNPLGIGWGQLYYYLPPGTRLPGVGVREYPHNVLIEVGSEAGVPALVVLVVVLVLALRGQQRVSTRPVESVMLALAVFALINSMVSGDVSDNRGLWVAVGAGLATRRMSFSDELADPETESVTRDTSARGVLTSPRSSQWPK
jgi:O-antigen ligase